MAKVLKCRDVGVQCDFEARGERVAEILQKATEHAKGCHRGVQMTPQLQAKIIAVITDEDSSCCGGTATSAIPT